MTNYRRMDQRAAKKQSFIVPKRTALVVGKSGACWALEPKTGRQITFPATKTIRTLSPRPRARFPPRPSVHKAFPTSNINHHHLRDILFAPRSKPHQRRYLLVSIISNGAQESRRCCNAKEGSFRPRTCLLQGYVVLAHHRPYTCRVTYSSVANVSRTFTDSSHQK